MQVVYYLSANSHRDDCQRDFLEQTAVAKLNNVPTKEGGLISGSGSQEKQRVAWVSVLAAVALTAMKLVAGLVTGSIAVLAEAAHSALDLVATLMTLFAVRVADKPPDSEHQYGHGKVEHLSALFEIGLLVITCLWIFYESIQRLVSGQHHIELTVWAFVVMLISIVVDYWRSRALGRAAKKYHSDALAADALHFRTDIWSSSIVLLGLSLVFAGDLLGLPSVLGGADAIAALVVGGIVLSISGRLGKTTIDALLDRAPDLIGQEIGRAVRSITGVQEVRRMRLRRSGNRVFADLVVGVPRTTTFADAHEMTERIERAISHTVPRTDTVVHFEPVTGRDETAVDQIHFLAHQHGVQAHAVHVREVDGDLDANLHVELDAGMSLDKAHEVATLLEEAVRAANPGIKTVNTHLEVADSAAEPRTEVTDERQLLIDQITRLADSIAGTGSCHYIRVYESSQSRIDLVLHCTLPAELPIRPVHDISTEVEMKLRDKIARLDNVLVHVEPAPAS